MGKLAQARFSDLHDGWERVSFFIIPHPTCWSWWSHLGLTKITHALPVPVYLQTDLTPKRVVVSRLHDTVAKSRTGVKFSPRCENRGELTPGRIASAWHIVMVSCKQMYSYEREPEWTRPGAKVDPVSCKHPLTLSAVSHNFRSLTVVGKYRLIIKNAS